MLKRVRHWRYRALRLLEKAPFRGALRRVPGVMFAISARTREKVKRFYTQSKRGTCVKYKMLQASRTGHKWLERLKAKSGHLG